MNELLQKLQVLFHGATPLAIWGAALSTLLAGLKVWEVWRARIRIEIGYNFTSDENIGNDVIVRNLSSTPLLVAYWELVWRKRRLLGWKESYLVSPEDGNTDIKINSHSSIKLTFNEMNYFSTNYDAVAGRKIFIRFYIAGRSWPILRKVYG